MLNFCFVISKRHILVRNHVVWRILPENLFRGLGCRPLEDPGQKKKLSKKRSWVNIFDAQFRAYGGKETLWGIVTKCCMWVDIWGVISCATFGDDRLRGLGEAGGEISHFPIDLRRRPYNTLALPRECVNKKLGWCWQTCAMRLEISKGHQTWYHLIC